MKNREYRWEKIRYAFLRWLRAKSKVEEGRISPKWIQAIYRILFPFHSMYERQSQVHFNAVTGVYNIRGIQIDYGVLDFFANQNSIGKKFKFIKKENGTITIEVLCDL